MRGKISERRKQKYLESDKSETDESYQRENKILFKKMETTTKGYGNDLVDTNTGQETNN